MSRDSSPASMSNDSAIGSVASNGANNINNNNRVPPLISANDNVVPISQSSRTYGRTSSQIMSRALDAHATPQAASANDNRSLQVHNSSIQHGQIQEQTRDQIVRPEELRSTSKQMRYKNTTLLSRSIRTNLSCFDDLDVQRMDYRSDFLVNFISKGVNKSPVTIQRPMSILWPDSYDKMIDELSILDAYLINTDFKEKPIDWMLNSNLTSVPECKICKQPMTLKYELTNVSWRCNRTQPCHNLYAPIQRPIFFKGYEHVGLLKILFSIYYWAICTQCDLLYAQLKLEPQTLHGIWQSLQNVCRVALEKSYPRFRLCNNPNSEDNQSNSQIQASTEPIDLISIKFNSYYIVCAKHPRSNCVRLGLHVPKTSKYTFADLTESWFAHGAKIRVCENKFLDLPKKRIDLSVTLVTRPEMVTKDGVFYRESAFGYLTCQLCHIFKDFDSSEVSLETLKLILAELEWRELYGTNPYDAFTKIIDDMSQHKGTMGYYFEPIDINGEEVASEIEVRTRERSEYIFAEKYFYSTMHPIDSRGNEIHRYGKPEPENGGLPMPIVRFRCHLCDSQHESFYFSMHILAHVEANRKDTERDDFLKTNYIRCKHCFKQLLKEEIVEHARLFRTDLHTIKFGCRICCIKFPDKVNYLGHMRRTHFEHEMPYRCPKCKFASSFQRELAIHFQEEHQHEHVIMCPFCLKSWTISNPDKLDIANMSKVSQVVYNHTLEHYIYTDRYSCDKCCLSFLNASKLERHKAKDHNPSEVYPEKEVKVEPFIVTRQEEEYCVMALPVEFFIPNKRPNMAIDEASQAAASSVNLTQQNDIGIVKVRRLSHVGRASTSRQADENDIRLLASSSGTDDEDEEHFQDCLPTLETDTIHVRPSKNTRRFLDNGSGAISLCKSKATQNEELSTEKILDGFSRFPRADCVIPNQSVIVTPDGHPIKCSECWEYMTADHCVAAIKCRPCKYVTHCPTAATRHKQQVHKVTTK